MLVTVIRRYVVVSGDGHLYGSPNSLYDTTGKAQRWCCRDGDCVVAVDVDLTREPLFIRRKVITGKA